ncbi:MAG TPA: hypothetical protein VFG30_15060 [Polyangiales bacterium]|jgi:hypothetical protein|nr:hypothetical protein [Polyangiales bacterium]
MIARATALRLLLFFGFCALGSAGCGGDRYIVVGTAKAPSVSGWVVIKDASKNGAEVTIHLEQVHPPSHLDPSLKAYVAWFEPETGPAVRAGTLKYLPDERTGELRARAPFGKFVVKVTGEANDKPSDPSDFLVASQEITLED